MIDGSLVCVITTRPSPSPVYLADSKDEGEFYVRVASTTRSLTHREMLEYVKRQWG